MNETLTKGKSASKFLGFNFALLKSGSAILGVLYALTLLLMIPVFSSMGLSFDNMLVRAGMIVLSIVIIHFSINGLYYMLVTVPLVLTISFFVVGWAIWLFTPFVFIFVDIFASVLSVFGLGDLLKTQNLSDFWTRIGQTFMGIGTGIWWLTKKVKDINYPALLIYIIALTLVGLFTSSIQYSYPVIFLLLWATVSYKIHEDPRFNANEELSIVMKIVISLALLIGAFKNIYVANNTWYGEKSFGLIIYSILTFLAVSYGVWKPKKILKLLPKEARKLLKSLIENMSKFVFIKLG